jgi:thermitase
MKFSRKALIVTVVMALLALVLVPAMASELNAKELSQSTDLAGVFLDPNPTDSVDYTGRLIVYLDPGTTYEEMTAVVRDLNATLVEYIAPLDVVIVSLNAAAPVALLEPDTTDVDGYEADLVAFADIAIPPNDPQYSDQWALPHIEAEAAWKSISGELKTVTVAVIDTGVCMNHEDLQGRVLDTGYDFVDDDKNPDDVFGHGCAVAGIIAANTDNNIGIAGFAPNSMILPIRVLGPNGSGSMADVAAGIVYAADNGADIINLSLGSSIGSKVEKDAIDYAVSKGVLVIASAGNSAGRLPGFPARYDNVVAVGAIDSDGSRSSFSNLGGDIWAPGRDVLTIYLNDTYKPLNGTSFSAPYVSAMAALLQGMDKELNLDGGDMTWGCMMQGTCKIVPGSG